MTCLSPGHSWPPSDLYGLLDSRSSASEQTPAFCQDTGSQLKTLELSAQTAPRANYSRISGGWTQASGVFKAPLAIPAGS